MAPCILHRALSFSNLPIHRLDLLSLQEPSGVSGRHEGLALLTTIAEGGGGCNPSAPLPSHAPLEKRLVSKILRLREALDLPCQSSRDLLGELLSDTLEALKIAYPKCLSGLSEHNTSSVQQGLVNLHKVLKSVQDCHAEHKQMHNFGSEKHTTVESQSIDQVGEDVIEMLDQVTPMAKEIFSSMETSKGANAAAAAAWSEDFLERRTLPPVLCRPRSPSHREHIRDRPSDSAEVAMPCQDGTVMRRDQSKIQEATPRQDASEGDTTRKDGQACRREPPSSTAGDGLLQSTPSSVSPHPLSAPPLSPVPMTSLPMLLQSWEAMQDDNAAAAMLQPPAAQPVDQAALIVQQDASIAVGSGSKNDVHASSVSTASSMDSLETTQPPVQDVNAAVPNVPPPPPAHRDVVQEQSSTNKPVERVASAPPPPPPSLVQGGPPAPPPGKVPPGPPPPPPGNISAVLRAKRAASKLKRSTQMGSLYRHLRDKVEGSGCTHGGKRPHGKKAKTPPGTKGDAGQGMTDALAEMTKRSAYFRQIEEDAENHAATILELKDAIGSFQSKDMGELVRFHQHVEQQLVCLTDETQVLARFDGFPSKKLETLRMAAALHTKLDGAVSTLHGWKLAAPVWQQLDKVEGYFNKIKDDVDLIERNKDEEMKRFQSHGIYFDFGVLVRIKECMVDLSSNCMELALKESQDAKEAPSTRATNLSKTLWRVFQLAFRVYNFAGGQDDRADRLTSILAHEIEAHPL